MAIQEEIQRAIQNVSDQRSFIQELLGDTLGWPVDRGVEQIEDISFAWTTQELDQDGLDRKIVNGEIWQIQPFSTKQPWGIFILEFKNEDVFLTARGMTGTIRKILQRLVPKERGQKDRPSWQRENLLFICTWRYERFRFAYFRAPLKPGRMAPLVSFSWRAGDTHVRTLCEHNLAHLAWPADDGADTESWIRQWTSAFDVEAVTKRFFLEIANWYFWALQHVRFPKDAPKESDGCDHVSVIRLITRLIFCWFVKEKGLIPDVLFDEENLAETLNGFAPADDSDNSSVFYRAILQNLFFATLNTEMDRRAWTKDEQHFMAHSLYRYKECFRRPAVALDFFKNIPFLNGGLFECLDKDLGRDASPRYLRVDGFSRRTDSQPVVPDFLFYASEREVDLSEAYGDTKFRRTTVRGLIHTFNRYRFTIMENTPLEQEVALDPELSGKVFENLLAAYNPETGATARKQTGSFYTPREIVEHMVDESLLLYLLVRLAEALPSTKKAESRLRDLLSYTREGHEFTSSEVCILIEAIDNLRSLDPAVGSGAFPMGILHKLVFILGKLDPRNERWKDRQVQRVRGAITAAEEIEDAAVRERTVTELEQQIGAVNEAFERNDLDYGRKLFLIENCIYGVDIQAIAVQIAKMRFFISLIVDQRPDPRLPNLGVMPLPNLETKFVAANTLVGVDRPGTQLLRNMRIDDKEDELRRVRERHFNARTLSTKAKYRDQDAKLRAEIADMLERDGWDTAVAGLLSSWNPYDQNTTAGFFDPEWMFGVKGGFHIVLGNPPYIDSENMTKTNPGLRKAIQSSYCMTRGNWDIYIAFFEKGFNLLGSNAVLAFITPDKWTSKPFGDELRLRRTDNLYSVLKAGRQVFESAKVDAIVSLFTTWAQPLIRTYEHTGRAIEARRSIDKTVLKSPFTFDWLFSDFLDLLMKIDHTANRLSDYGQCENACATSDAYKLKEFICEQPGGAANPEFLRIVNTGTIGKYVSMWGEREMVYLGGRYLRPAVNRAQFLKSFRNSYGQKSIKPKIIIKGLNLLDGCLDGDGTVIPGKTTLIITSPKMEDLKILLGVVNSRLAFFYIKERYPSSSYNEGTTFTKEMLNDLPMPNLGQRERADMLSIVDRCLSARATKSGQAFDASTRALNEIVYSIYGLSADEIRRIDG